MSKKFAIEYKTKEEVNEILQWLEENTDFIWHYSMDKPTAYIPNFIKNYNILILISDDTLGYARFDKKKEALGFLKTCSGIREILTFEEAKDKILGVEKEKEDHNRGMVYNPVSGKWNWGF
jgi:hypothetical protein